MTMMGHKLIRVRGDEDWDAWGEDSRRHVEVLGKLQLGHIVADASWLDAQSPVDGSIGALM